MSPAKAAGKRSLSLGELEDEVMHVVWKHGRVTVKDVASRLSRERAYNTVQTTLDRLYRKGLLSREKESHAFVFSAAVTRDEFNRRLMSTLMDELFPRDREHMLAAFVDMAEARNPKNLETLAALIQKRRKRPGTR